MLLARSSSRMYAGRMDHPFDKLSISNGQLLHRPIGNMQQDVPYMATAEVEILGKESQGPVGEPPGYGRFGFKLNTAPDGVWKELFYKKDHLNRDAGPSIEGKLMVLVCDPGNVKLYYGYIKTAIGETNVAYKTERESVVRRVEQEMARREMETKRQDEIKEKIKRSFDDLEL